MKPDAGSLGLQYAHPGFGPGLVTKHQHHPHASMAFEMNSMNSHWTRKLSTTCKGTAFEKRSLYLLQTHLSMTLRRSGGKSDGGIDLQGWWWLPNPHAISRPPTLSHSSGNELSKLPPEPYRRRIRVFAQCKAEKKRLGPKYIREMEGAVSRYLPWVKSPPVQLSGEMEEWLELEADKLSPLVAIVISESRFTKEALLSVHSSPIPFLLLHIPPTVGEVDEDFHLDGRGTSQTTSSDLVPDDKRENPFGGVYCNKALVGRTGILGGQMEVRWVRSSNGFGRPSLWLRDDNSAKFPV